MSSLIGVGTNPNDHTGDPLRTACQKINKWASLGDATVNAASYPGSTKEAQIQAAINDPAADAVFIPDSMLPFNASLVTSLPTVKMIGEGTNPKEYDLRSYGFGLGGASDVAAQAAADAASLNNTGLGAGALGFSASGARNLAVGDYALSAVTTGYNNVAIGYQAGNKITTGQGNTAIGVTALFNMTTALYNTAVGVDALYTCIDGYSNTGLGADALGFLDHGYQNTAVGFNASFSTTSGQNNVAVGFKALYTATTGNGSVAIGAFAGYYETGSNAFYVNNQDRTNLAGDKASSLMYGTFNATASLQTLAINAVLTLPYGMTATATANAWGGTFSGTGGTQIVALGNEAGVPSVQAFTAAFAAYTNLRVNADGGNVVIGAASSSTTLGGTFGCNGAVAQAAYASGGALAAYGAGTNGFDTAAHAQALYNLVVSIRAALVANGIMN